MEIGILNEQLLVRTIDKIKVYQTDENKDLSNIKTIFNQMDYSYESNNIESLKNVCFELEKKFKIIKNIHYNNTYVIEHNMKKIEKAIEENNRD